MPQGTALKIRHKFVQERVILLDGGAWKMVHCLTVTYDNTGKVSPTGEAHLRVQGSYWGSAF